MPIKFLFDEQMKERERLIKDIDYYAKKRAYPDNETYFLARFIECAFLGEGKEQEQMGLEQEEGMGGKKLPLLAKKLPSAPTKKSEYVLNLFDMPVGVLVDTENGKHVYYLVEPHLEKEIYEECRGIKEKGEKKILSSIKRVCRRKGIEYSEDTIKKMKYFIRRNSEYGNITGLLEDEKVRAIYCDGANRPVFVDFEGERMRTNIVMGSDEVNAVVERIASLGRKERENIIDFVFEGIRYNAIRGAGGAVSHFVIKKMA
ncbi:hypothetical protein HZB88_01285 [archaeon]|nr:hypothetical protein [archaeon]